MLRVLEPLAWLQSVKHLALAKWYFKNMVCLFFFLIFFFFFIFLFLFSLLKFFFQYFTSIEKLPDTKNSIGNNELNIKNNTSNFFKVLRNTQMRR